MMMKRDDRGLERMQENEIGQTRMKKDQRQMSWIRVELAKKEAGSGAN